MSDANATLDTTAWRHIAIGWWTLLLFLSLGAALEVLHGLKVGWYLDVGNETRRLMWRLAHAHGALLGLVNVVFGLTVRSLGAQEGRSWSVPAAALLVATVLIPGGFFLGGLFIYGGDPGRGIVLLPIGAVALFAAVFAVAIRAARRR